MCEINSTSGLGRRIVFRKTGDFVLSIPVVLMLGLLRIYQWVFSPLKRVFFGPTCGCRFQPSCSCYAYDAFARFGFFRGLWFTLRRLLRCHPWHPGGFDPLPETNNLK